MTESEWLTSADPVSMLELVTGKAYTASSDATKFQRYRATDRQLRLFAVACCRRFPVSGEMEALSVAERFADGLATYEELRTAGLTTVGGGSWIVCFPQVSELVQHLLTDGHFRGQEFALCSILRDIIGNPYRPVTIDPSWLTWRDGTIPRLARTAYEERVVRQCERCKNERFRGFFGSDSLADAFYEEQESRRCPDCHGTGTTCTGELDPGNLAILADALEEAGCDKQSVEDCSQCGGHGWIGRLHHDGKSETYPCPVCQGGMLAHLRSPGPHYRGCWAVDLLTGKG